MTLSVTILLVYNKNINFVVVVVFWFNRYLSGIRSYQLRGMSYRELRCVGSSKGDGGTSWLGVGGRTGCTHQGGARVDGKYGVG